MPHLVFIRLAHVIIRLAHVFIDVYGVVRGGVHIHNSILLLLAAGNVTAEAALELMSRVVGMLGVCCLVCGVATVSYTHLTLPTIYSV